MADALMRYTPLELDLESGGRGGRMAEIEALLGALTGAEATLVVNNNAAATMLTLAALAPLNRDRREVMAARLERRRRRARNREPITFLDPGSTIARTGLTVQAARDGRFDGAEIPTDLRRQWVQGTGPGAKPRSEVRSSIRNIAYALLSGADGWMFDGEDAMGQVDTMSLDNQRNLRLAVARDPLFREHVRRYRQGGRHRGRVNAARERARDDDFVLASRHGVEGQSLTSSSAP